ncbi:VanZ family protein [Microbacterium sp. NPDC090007]|uniref:VanZ family protein n=1 Tax=Microbacterium sp. NPDC090007 TaxID=3364204 RepID=UPI003813BB39
MPSVAPPRPRRLVVGFLAGSYVVGLAVVLLWPDHLDRDVGLLYGILSAMFPTASAGQVDFALNVALFVPFGVMSSFLLGRRSAAVVAVALAVPIAVETVQALFLPARTASVADVVANVVGALTGAVLTGVIRRRLTRDGTPRTE